MRIHDHIRDNPRFRAGHIMGPQTRTNGALLAMAIRKFVAQFRNTILDHTNLHEAQTLIIHHDRHALHSPPCPYLRRDGRILHSSLADQIRPHDHRRFIHIGTLLNDTVIVQLGIIQTRTELSPLRNLRRVAESHLGMRLLIILFKRLIGSKGHRTKHTSLNGVLVHHNTVLLVVS